MIYSRVTTESMSQNTVKNITTNKSKLSELSQQVSTGNKINKPSDDPVATYNILTVDTTLSKIDRYISNISYGQSELAVTEQAMGDAVDLIQKAKDLATQASNATQSSNELNDINSQIVQIMDQLKEIGNTKFGDTYIFGGVNTNNPPYTTDSTTGDIVYSGTAASSDGSADRQIEISDGVKVTINFTGDNVFGNYTTTSAGPPPVYSGSGVLYTLKKLSQALTANPVDYNAISSKIDDLGSNLNSVINTEAKVGAISSRLEITNNRLKDEQVTYKSYKSDAQDIDLAQAVSDYQYQKTAYEASLQVGAQVLQTSLLKYL